MRVHLRYGNDHTCDVLRADVSNEHSTHVQRDIVSCTMVRQ